MQEGLYLVKSPESSNPPRSANESVRTNTGSGVISLAQRKPGYRKRQPGPSPESKADSSRNVTSHFTFPSRR
jgi:hypothetical protein